MYIIIQIMNFCLNMKSKLFPQSAIENHESNHATMPLGSVSAELPKLGLRPTHLGSGNNLATEAGDQTDGMIGSNIHFKS